MMIESVQEKPRNNACAELKTIKNIENLKENWNGYGAKPIDPDVISLARTLLITLDEEPEIFPTGRRTIQLQYELLDDSYLEFEIYPDHIHTLFVPKRIYSKAKEDDIKIEELHYVKKIVEKFLDGELV